MSGVYIYKSPKEKSQKKLDTVKREREMVADIPRRKKVCEGIWEHDPRTLRDPKDLQLPLHSLFSTHSVILY